MVRKRGRSAVVDGWGRDEGGSALVMSALGLVVFLGMAALAVDVGMLFTARSQAQRAADAGALAGAGHLLVARGDEPGAKSAAEEFAETHNVMRTTVEIDTAADVEVELDEEVVRVFVRAQASRGGPVSTLFARILGWNTVDVSAMAAAKVVPAGGVECPLPLTIPDRWIESGTVGSSTDYMEDTETYDETSSDPDDGVGDSYEPWDPDNPTDPYTGYDQDAYGQQITLKDGSGGGTMNASWYYPWRPPGQSGGSDYRQNILGCHNTEGMTFSVGQEVDTEPGNMVGPTTQGFQELINKDPNAYWDADASWNPGTGAVTGCVKGSTDTQWGDAGECRWSPRIRPVPMFSPAASPNPGAMPFTFTNFAGLFVEDLSGSNVIARFMGYTGVNPVPIGANDESAGPNFRALVLIE